MYFKISNRYAIMFLARHANQFPNNLAKMLLELFTNKNVSTFLKKNVPKFPELSAKLLKQKNVLMY